MKMRYKYPLRQVIRMENQIGPESRKLLEAFDAPGRGPAAGGLTLAAMAGANQAPEPEKLQAIAEELVAHGWLRREGETDTYARTESGRLAAAGALDVTIYTRPGCHLCDEAKAQIAPLVARAGGRLREINIDAEPELRERYNVDVPVIWLGARKVAKHRVDLEQFRRQLESSQQKSSG
jgi:glutaredoxin